MNSAERSDYVVRLDDELLMGGVILSEWSVFLAKSADTAFVAGADLATILTAQAAMECHLRYEYRGDKGAGFYQLIESSPLPPEMCERLHTIRRFRNRWVHVPEPHLDEHLLTDVADSEVELETIAIESMRLMRQVLYYEVWL